MNSRDDLRLMRHIATDGNYSVESSEWNRREFLKDRDASSDVKKAARFGEEFVPGFQDLQVDGYNYLFQGNPIVKDDDEIDQRALWHKRVIETAKGTEEFNRLRGFTIRNRVNSLMGVCKLNDVVEQLPEEMLDAIRDQNEIGDELDKKQDELESLRKLWQDLDDQENDDDATDDGEDGEGEALGGDAGSESESGEGDSGSANGSSDTDGDSGSDNVGDNDGSPSDVDDSGEGSEGSAGQSGNGTSKSDVEQRGQEVASEVADLEQAMEEATQKMNAAFDQNREDIESDVREAMRQGANEAEELEDAMDAFSCGQGAGEHTHLSYEEQVEAAQLLEQNQELKWIAELAGRLERISRKAKQDDTTAPVGQIVDVEPSGDLHRLLPGELAKFAHPIAKKQLLMDVADHKALSYKKELKDDCGRGPVICCVDSSGSMDSGAYSLVHSYTQGSYYRENTNTKHKAIIWAKAVALALYREAAARNQPFIYVHFSSGWGENDGLDVRQFDGRPGEELEFMKFSTIFHRGGTDYELALGACLKAFENPGMEKSDVVFISDGEYPRNNEMGEQFKAKMRELEGFTLGVLIKTGSTYYGSEDERPYDGFADAAWSLNLDDLRDGNDVPVIQEMFTDWLGQD